jgi:hypothetical protein
MVSIASVRGIRSRCFSAMRMSSLFALANSARPGSAPSVFLGQAANADSAHGYRPDRSGCWATTRRLRAPSWAPSTPIGNADGTQAGHTSAKVPQYQGISAHFSCPKREASTDTAAIELLAGVALQIEQRREIAVLDPDRGGGGHDRLGAKGNAKPGGPQH